MDNMSKTICCISSKKDWQESIKLCKFIYDKTGISISVLNSMDSVVNYDVVIYVHSKNSAEDGQIQKWLKEASDLNKMFVPVIIGGNVISNKYLAYKYNGPNLRTDFISLCGDNQKFDFLDTLASLSGACLQGDVIGAKVNLVSDLDAKVYRDNKYIAELKANCSTAINLRTGVHCLQVIPSIENPFTRDIKIAIANERRSEKEEIHFLVTCILCSDLDCKVYHDGRYIGQLSGGQKSTFQLLNTKSKLSFICESNGSKLEEFIEIDGDLNEGLSHEFSVSFTAPIKICSDSNCLVYQDDRFIGKLQSNEIREFRLVKGKCSLTFEGMANNSERKTTQVEISNSNSSVLSIIFKQHFPTEIERNIPRILRLYTDGKQFTAKKVIVDSYGCSYDQAQTILDDILKCNGVKFDTKPKITPSSDNNVCNSSSQYIRQNYASIAKLYTEGKYYAAAQYFKDAYNCDWDEAKRKLHSLFNTVGRTTSQKGSISNYPQSITRNQSHILSLYRENKMFAAAQYFKDAYNCTWDQAKVKLQEFVRNNA